MRRLLGGIDPLDASVEQLQQLEQLVGLLGVDLRAGGGPSTTAAAAKGGARAAQRGDGRRRASAGAVGLGPGVGGGDVCQVVRDNVSASVHWGGMHLALIGFGNPSPILPVSVDKEAGLVSSPRPLHGPAACLTQGRFHTVLCCSDLSR